MSDLKKQAEELGIKVDGRWSDAKIQEVIDEKLAAGPETPARQQEPVNEPETSAGPDQPVADQISVKVDFSDEDAFTVKNLKANPMRSLGLGSYGERTFKVREGADPVLMKKIQRGVELGLIKVLELE